MRLHWDCVDKESVQKLSSQDFNLRGWTEERLRICNEAERKLEECGVLKANEKKVSRKYQVRFKMNCQWI